MVAFKPITVSQFSTYVKKIFDAEELLHGISIVGEISGWSNTRGTAYFTLKDESSALSCVCFTADSFSQFKNGDSVMVIGSARYYTKTGKLNFNVVRIEPYGENVLYQKFLELKNTLESKGYFDSDRKKNLPANIKRIGVVSSEGGAVIQDIINVAHRRNPAVDIVLYPVKVQGVGAENEIAYGINVLDRYDVDVIVVARGGGSFEDLQPFNTEIVADAVYNCKKPLVSAVGHETDYTIIDFCSDLRAPTPSAAAEILCKDIASQKTQYRRFVKYLVSAMQGFVENKEQTLSAIAMAANKEVEYIQQNAKIFLKNKTCEFYRVLDLYMSKRAHEFEGCYMRLAKLNPSEILKLGYACVKLKDAYINSICEININDKLEVNFKDGKVIAAVSEINKSEA